MTAFVTSNPAFEAVVRESFARQTFMGTLGAALELVEPGRVHVAVAAAPSLCQQNGFLACARVLRAGRTLTVTMAEVFGLGPSGRELVAAMLSTIIARPVTRATSEAR